MLETDLQPLGDDGEGPEKRQLGDSLMSSQIKQCQGRRKIVTHSLGEAIPQVGFSTDSQAQTFADKIWGHVPGRLRAVTTVWGSCPRCFRTVPLVFSSISDLPVSMLILPSCVAKGRSRYRAGELHRLSRIREPASRARERRHGPTFCYCGPPSVHFQLVRRRMACHCMPNMYSFVRSCRILLFLLTRIMPNLGQKTIITVVLQNLRECHSLD